MWKSIIVIKLETFWKFTPEIEGSWFRLRHIEPPKSPVGWVGQAEAIPNTSFHNYYELQRVNGLTFYESIKFKKPPIFTARKLAFRQETRVPNNWLIEVEVCTLPSYSLDDPAPTNPTAAGTKNVTNVPVASTPTKILSANLQRKGVKFFSGDKQKTIYLDTDNVVSATSAIESLTPAKPLCIPAILWTGEWWAISTAGSVTIEVEEYI